MKKNYTTEIKKSKITLRKVVLFLMIGLIMPFGIYAQTVTYSFTAAGVTGPTGPTQTQINTAYSSTNLNGSVTVTGGIQTFTVPSTGPYRIIAIGAQGAYTGGRGAYISGDYTLTAGTVLKILVGQTGTQGNNGSYNGGGGGGGSFVSSTANVPYVVAGGGGGNADGYTGVPVTCCSSGMEATITSSANPFPSGSNGGTSGNGGTCSGFANAGAGAGFYGAGSACNSGGAPASFTNGGTGGTGNSSTGDGGFGGGAGCYNSGVGQRGGGGGGYSGGGGGVANSGNDAAGGGGASFNSGANQTNSISTGSGSGLVRIDQLCNVRITSSGTNSISPSICAGNSITLTTNAISNYTWSNGNTTNTSIVVSPSSSQTYSIVGTTSLACSAAGSISVTVSSTLPALTITNTPNTLCLGKSTSVTAGGALTYTWTNGASTTPVFNGVPFTPTATASYTVTGQNGCGVTTSVTSITIAPLVVMAITTPTAVCVGATATLAAASSVTGYTWQPGNYTGASPVVAPSVPTVYTVTASDGTCVGVTTVSVGTILTPTITVASSGSMVCEGGVVTMTASGALTYSWTTPANTTGAVISVTPTIPTAYNVIGTNSLNCSSQAGQIVVTASNPTVTIASNKTLTCPGGVVTLTASGAGTYVWTGGPSTDTNTINPQSTGTYTVIGTSASNTCTNLQTITINVLNASVSISASSPGICSGASVTLTASGANSYAWPGIGGGATINQTPASTTVYTVNATTTSGTVSCPSSANVTITVFNNPTVTIVATKTVMCKNDAGPKLTANGSVTSYTWSTGANTQTVNVSPTTTNNNYTVNATDANGCTNSQTIKITVNNCTGISEVNGDEPFISVYPNPSNGEFTITSSSDLQLKLINELGQLIQLMNLTKENDHKVFVHELTNGVYFLVGQNSTTQLNQKIVVAK